MGEVLVSEGTIKLTDIEEAKNRGDRGRKLTVGLPAYCILQTLLRSARADSCGILLSKLKKKLPFFNLLKVILSCCRDA